MVSYIYITPFILKDPKALCKPRMEVTSAFAEIWTTGVKHAKFLTSETRLLHSSSGKNARQVGTNQNAK